MRPCRECGGGEGCADIGRGGSFGLPTPGLHACKGVKGPKGLKFITRTYFGPALALVHLKTLKLQEPCASCRASRALRPLAGISCPPSTLDYNQKGPENNFQQELPAGVMRLHRLYGAVDSLGLAFVSMNGPRIPDLKETVRHTAHIPFKQM